jgi:oxygen-independent coproporphyrinogen III oxidase
MAGIYIHVPWCRKACIYCDFHFSVSTRNKHELLECMKTEIELQQDYLGSESIETIYFGGGTPSILTPREIHALLEKIQSFYKIDQRPEISIEINPDDITTDYLKELKTLGINRLSIGIQSFSDYWLNWMNRRHDARQALQSIELSILAGFANISIDMIYGLPGYGTDEWASHLEKAFKSGIQHLSAYHLTLEDKTIYARQVKRGLLEMPDEPAGLEQFELLMDMAEKKGFEHYEISNFCTPGFYSRHNTSYWFLKPYLGIGPSANSFNGRSRQWNIRNNTGYINSIKKGVIPFGSEELDKAKKYNELILTSLRTMWGIDPSIIEKEFGAWLYEYFNREADILVGGGKLERWQNRLRLSKKGKFFADGIIAQLFHPRS